MPSVYMVCGYVCVCACVSLYVCMCVYVCSYVHVRVSAPLNSASDVSGGQQGSLQQSTRRDNTTLAGA